MNVTTLSEPGVTPVELEGSIDGKTAPQIREEFSAALPRVQKLIIDMSRVDYLSSAGLRLRRGFRIRRGRPLPFGTAIVPNGVNFSPAAQSLVR